MTRTVVILGAGMAGIPIAHHILGNTLTQVPDLRVILVSPNEEFYWKLASIRLALPPGVTHNKIPKNDYMTPIAPAFAKYPRDKFKFVLGSAEELLPDQNAVLVRLNNNSNGNGPGPTVRIEYHTIFITTGSRYRDSMPWKELSTDQETQAAIARLQSQVAAATHIAIAGGGVTGTELAAELGHAYCRSGAKKVTLIGTDPLPLEPRLTPAVRRHALTQLRRLGVEYLGNTRISKQGADPHNPKKQSAVLSSSLSPNGETTTRTFDLIIPTYGSIYNTSFCPAHMFPRFASPPGRLSQNPDLRSPQHQNVFILGDAGSLQPPQAVFVESQLRHVMTQLLPYFSSTAEAPEQIRLAPYVFDKDEIMIGFSLGPMKGSGQAMKIRIPGFIIWWVKSRTLGTQLTAPYVRGERGHNGGWPK